MIQSSGKSIEDAPIRGTGSGNTSQPVEDITQQQGLSKCIFCVSHWKQTFVTHYHTLLIPRIFIFRFPKRRENWEWEDDWRGDRENVEGCNWSRQWEEEATVLVEQVLFAKAIAGGSNCLPHQRARSRRACTGRTRCSGGEVESNNFA